MSGTVTMSEAELKVIRERCEAATGGPWWWQISLRNRTMELVAKVRGIEFVMQFRRWGMNSAKAWVRKPHPEGYTLMADADEFAAVVPGREHHADWFQTLRHPDLDFIAAARSDVPRLLDEIERLAASLPGAEGTQAGGKDVNAPTVLGTDTVRQAGSEQGVAAQGESCRVRPADADVQPASPASPSPVGPPKTSFWEAQKRQFQREAIERAVQVCRERANEHRKAAAKIESIDPLAITAGVALIVADEAESCATAIQALLEKEGKV